MHCRVSLASLQGHTFAAQSTQPQGHTLIFSPASTCCYADLHPNHQDEEVSEPCCETDLGLRLTREI